MIDAGADVRWLPQHVNATYFPPPFNAFVTPGITLGNPLPSSLSFV
jgi:hypothetical protein